MKSASSRSNRKKNKSSISFILAIKNISRTKLLRLLKLLIIVLIITAILFKTINVLKIKNVSCYVGGVACPGIYIIDVKEIKNKNLLFINKEEIINYIINHNAIVSSVKVVKKIPNSLNIYIVNRKSEYLLITREQTFAIDKDGVVLTLGENEQIAELVPIETDESFAVGQKIVSPAILVAMKITKLLENSNLHIKSVSTSDITDISIMLNSNILLKFNGLRDIDKQVDSIKLIIDQPINKDNLPIKEIDVRFDDPIIRN